VDSNKVEIFGRHYSIGGIEDRAYLDELAGFVDAQMRQVVESTGTVDTHRVAILAALSIADYYFKAKREHRRQDEETGRDIAALSERIRLALSP